jgi:CTP:molybdopterin cytidylyltransferase MocA
LFVHLLIAAAGSGRRMGAAGNKLLLEVAGRPDAGLDAGGRTGL